jgi:transposase
MYHCEFSTEDQRHIQYQRYHHHDPVVRKRMTILWHKHCGLPHHQIAKFSDAAPNTVTATIRTFLEKGVAGVEERKFYSPPSQLDPYRSRLISHFSEHPPRTLKEAAAEIERLTKVSFTLSHVRNFLIDIGLSRKKQEAFQGRSIMTSGKNKNHLLTIGWSLPSRMLSRVANTSTSSMQSILCCSPF